MKLRRKDGEPLSMSEMRETLHELAQRLLPLEKDCRVKRATLYLALIDEEGNPFMPPDGDTLEICAYDCAAEQYEPQR